MHERPDILPPPVDVSPPPIQHEVVRRGARYMLVAAMIAVAALAGCTHGHSGPRPTVAASSEVSPSSAPLTAEQQADEAFIQQTASSLLALGEQSHGGLRFQSEIQTPNYQTDRDVGAASVGMGFLELADQYPSDAARWIEAAKQTATWLTAMSKQDANGGRYWPDYANDGDVSESHYTSFDDGAIGIGDFYWRLYEKTGDTQYKDIALQSVQWTLSKAENVGSGDKPMYRWLWDTSDPSSGYNTGMGMGSVGIINALATYYDRVKEGAKDADPALAAKYKHYIDGGLRWLNHVRSVLGKNGVDSRALPETGSIDGDGGTVLNSGYLSGAAGGIYLYMHLYKIFGDEQYLHKADELFGWLNDTGNGPKVDKGNGMAAWRAAIDPQDDDPADQKVNAHLATGFEEGNAGIGWSLLQASKVAPRDKEKYLTAARQAADWLIHVAIKGPNGELSWHEYENPASPLVHKNLNNGAAGIGMFLMDMYDATKDTKYLDAAKGVQKWLETTAVRDGSMVYWKDVDTDDNGKIVQYRRDPSWHWGDSGIITFLLRMNNGQLDMPGEQPGL